jgi:hypothetical protein
MFSHEILRNLDMDLLKGQNIRTTGRNDADLKLRGQSFPV